MITESKVFAKSMYTTSAVFPSSINRVIISSNIMREDWHGLWGRKPCLTLDEKRENDESKKEDLTHNLGQAH